MDFTSPPLSLHDNGFTMVPTDPFRTSEEEMKRLKEELKMWKERVEEAENRKADLLLSKTTAEEECARTEMKLKEQEKQNKDRIVIFEEIRDLVTGALCPSRIHGVEQAWSSQEEGEEHEEQELFLLNQGNTELKKEIKKLKEELEEYSALDNSIKKNVAEMQLKFTHLADMKEHWADMDTHCVFGATTKIPFKLNQNQALLTFEDEKVAQRLTRMSKHSVNLDNRTANVTVRPFELEIGFQFELHVTVSGKKINVSEIPELPIPEDWMRDKLELHFYKTVQGGGGEIEAVNYDKESGTAVITFLRPGASNNFVACTENSFCAEGRCFKLSVSPYVDFHLRKFQPYCGVSKRTILLKGIPEVQEDEESVQDMIEIHFQKPSNGGGEIEKIKYISKGAACVCFEEDTGNAT